MDEHTLHQEVQAYQELYGLLFLLLLVKDLCKFVYLQDLFGQLEQVFGLKHVEQEVLTVNQLWPQIKLHQELKLAYADVAV